MTNRSIVVALKADVADFRRQMRSAGEETTSAMTDVGLAVTAIGAASAAAVALSVSKWAEFDQQMSAVQAATHETEANMARLSDAALKAGADTVFSATDAAGAVEELSKAGVSTSDVLGGGLQGALDLASAGTLEVGEAAETAASAMTQFRLKGEDVPHIADLLAASAGKAQGSVHDMGMALSQAGLVASQTGLSIEETTGGLAAFASAGLIGSDAGTAFKTMLQALTPSSVEAKNLMADLGISAYDAQGNFIGLADFAENLRTSLSGLSVEQQNAAMKTIFGSDAVRAAAVLYQQGGEGIQTWIDSTNDAGYASETAKLKLDNLRGDLEALGGAWDTAAIKTGAASDGMLRGGVQAATALIDAYTELGPSQQAVVLGGTALVAGVALVGGATLLAVPKIIAMRASLQLLATAAPRTATALRTVGAAAGTLAAVTAAVMVLDTAVKAQADSTPQGLEKTTEAILAVGTSVSSVDALIKGTSDGNWWNFDSLTDAAAQLADPTWEQQANDFLNKVISFGSHGAAGLEALESQLGTVGESLAAMVNAGDADLAAAKFQTLADQWVAGGGDLQQLKDLMPAYSDALTAVANGQSTAAQTGDQVSSALTGVTGTAEEAQSAIDDLTDALDRILAGAFSVEAATDNYSSALLKLKDAAKDNGRELDGNTEGALANREAMRGLVDDGFKVISAMAEQGSSAEELTRRSGELKKAFTDQARDAGFSAEAIEHYAAQFDLIPAQVATIVEANTTEAERQLQALAAKWAGKTITVQAIMDTSGLNRSDAASAARYTAGALAGRRAAGGAIHGPGTGTSDTAGLYALSNGEHVITAAEVSAAGGHSAVESWRAGLMAGVGRRATGGRVGADVGAGQTVTLAWLMAQLGAQRAPVTSARYDRAAQGEAITSGVAEATERRLVELRKANRAELEAYKLSLSDAEDAAKDQREAAVDGLEAELKALRARKVAKGGQAAQDAAEARLEDRIAAAKKANEQASKELSRANDKLIDQAEERAAAKEDKAELALTAAKDQAAAATEELRDAEAELNAERAESLRLAEQTADSLTRNANLLALFSDTRARDARGTVKGLAEALEQVGEAGRKMRGETAAQALQRRTKALEDLTAAGDAYADSQEALGAAPEAVQAGLADTIARIRELGSAYGLAAKDVDALTGSLTDRAAAGSDLITNMEAEAARAEETRDAIKRLMAAGLNSTSLDEVIGGGTTGGLSLARRLLSGGQSTIDQVNALQGRIAAAGADLGGTVAGARYAPDAKELKVAPITVSGGKLKVDGSLVALSEAVGLDVQTVAAMTTAFVAAAQQIPPPVVNVTNITQSFAKAP